MLYDAPWPDITEHVPLIASRITSACVLSGLFMGKL